jgi:hypothetical protein
MDWSTVIAIIPVIVGLSAGIYQAWWSSKDSRKVARERIKEAESRLEKEPEKAKPAWDLARVTLESYFNRNLSQINSIYWLSVIVMIVGFGILIWGISMAFRLSTVVVPSAIASAAGILTEFIGATFLFIYRSTIEQAINYSKTLERINSVGMAMQILDTMGDEIKSDDLKSKTKATLVELLVRQAYEATNSAQQTREKPRG